MADTADKWLFQPATPPTSRTTNPVSRSRNTGPFNMAFVRTTFGWVPNIWEGISLYGTRRRSKNSRCAFTVTDDPYQSFQSLDNTDWLPQEQKHSLMFSDHSFKIKARAQGKEYQKHNLSISITSMNLSK